MMNSMEMAKIRREYEAKQRYQVERLARSEYSIVDTEKDGVETQWRYRNYAEAESDRNHYNWMWNTEGIESL